MRKFIIEPHFRLQEWVADEKGYFRAEGLDYEFRELIRSTEGQHHNKANQGAFQSIEKGREANVSCACHWTVNVAASNGHAKLYADVYSVAPSVSVREEVESYESFMIQERWPDSEGPPMWTNENRARYDRSHLRYPSDLTDDEWQLVEPLIPPGRRGGDKRTVIMREVVNGLMYILSTGCQWRAIPKDLPPRSTLYDYFDLWSWDRTLDLIHHELYVKCREAIGREASPTAAVIDSQSVKSAEKDAMGQAARQL